MLADHQTRCCGEQGNTVCKRKEECARYMSKNTSESMRLALLCDDRYMLFVKHSEPQPINTYSNPGDYYDCRN